MGTNTPIPSLKEYEKLVQIRISTLEKLEKIDKQLAKLRCELNGQY
jgi:hypothetical protein